ncbi:M15 family metallopeptidase [Mycoplasmatota bacterium WC44]
MLIVSILLMIVLLFLESIREVYVKEDYLILVNKDNPIESDYVPDDLVKVDLPTIFDREVYISGVVLNAYEELYFNASENNLNLHVFSGYRSYTYQKEIFTNEFETARPGYSEHQIGLALDVSTPDIGLTEPLGEMPEGIWLRNNAYKYGFIIRYPQNKEHITKYIYEPWHLRYVGKYHAKKIHQKDLTLEEYLN